MYFRLQAVLYSSLGILAIVTQLFVSVHAHEPDCYPLGDKEEPQYLIGYGFLMQKENKDGTHPNTGESVPIRVCGYERSWTARGDLVSFTTTYLGVDTISNKSSCLNAVYFKISSAAALPSYDARETLYCREEVAKSRIELVTSGGKEKEVLQGQYWIYATKPELRKAATEEYPIVQSYVDRFISGCLELEAKHKLDGFADECVQSTSGWNSPWVNDRIYPRRPFLYQHMAGEIDGLLNRTVHEAFKKIVIEG